MSSIRNYYRKVIECFRKHVIFSKAVAFISGLVMVHGLVEYAVLAILVTHLTNDWGMILPHAAQTVNVHEGLSSLLVILFAQLSESFYGRFKVIVFTTAAVVSAPQQFTHGTLFQRWIFNKFIPRDFGWHIVPCHQCFLDTSIPHVQRKGVGMLWYEARRPSVSMLIGAVALLTVGKAGRDVPLKAFLVDQLHAQGSNIEDDEQLLDNRRKVWWRFSWTLGIIGATVCNDQEWKGLTMISFIAIVVGFAWFLLGMPYYVYQEPSPSPLRYVAKVVKAAISKRHLDYPVSPNKLFKNDTNDTQILPHIGFLRWLDKAATLEPSPPCPDQQQSASRLFEVAKVREVKSLLKLLPMWLTFLVYSLVESTGSTFFFVQADEMDGHLPIVFFIILKTFTSFIVSVIYPMLYKNANKSRRCPLLNRICIGMLCSVFCCLTAWRVEARRLSHVEIQSVFWLIPQFFLLGLMDGFANSGLEDFFRSQVCESLNRYGPEFNELALGFGKFISVICILIFRSWFNKDVNTSRLDKYYAMLLVPASLNFCICCLVCYWYGNQPQLSQISDDIAQELEGGIGQAVTNEESGLTSTKVVITVLESPAGVELPIKQKE